MKVCIIEDEQRLGHTIARGLRNNGMEVEVCHTGNNGIIKVMEQNPEVIILDWMLPDISGIEVLNGLREREIQTPVLMLTARSSIDDKVEGLESGADDYLTKPFEFAELVARVQVLGRRPAQIQTEVLEGPQLMLNRQTKEVVRDGVLVHLSAKEFDLLEYLLRYKGIVKNEQEILDAVWDFAEENISNKVPVYMRYLRNKIEKPFPTLPTVFETVRGMGYKLLDS